jgi:hypothetical protein
MDPTAQLMRKKYASVTFGHEATSRVLKSDIEKRSVEKVLNLET